MFGYNDYTIEIEGHEDVVALTFAFCMGKSWLWRLFHGFKKVTTHNITFNLTDKQLTMIVSCYQMYNKGGKNNG